MPRTAMLHFGGPKGVASAKKCFKSEDKAMEQLVANASCRRTLEGIYSATDARSCCSCTYKAERREGKRYIREQHTFRERTGERRTASLNHLNGAMNFCCSKIRNAVANIALMPRDSIFLSSSTSFLLGCLISNVVFCIFKAILFILTTNSN